LEWPFISLGRSGGLVNVSPDVAQLESQDAR